jgi:hypothetical protein
MSRMVETWGHVPIALIQKLSLPQYQYGFVGLQDYRMYPLLRPGCFVQIDNRPSRVSTSEWRTEFDRPIYFVKLRDSYACAWCEVRGSQLTLIPHPLSGCNIRQFAYPSEAEIIGRVTGVAMRLIPLNEDADEPARLPRRF